VTQPNTHPVIGVQERNQAVALSQADRRDAAKVLSSLTPDETANIFRVQSYRIFTIFHEPAGTELKTVEMNRCRFHILKMEKTIAMSMVVVFATFCGAYVLHAWKR
jgi:hypothetical protein